jgi:hypothetical protein
LRPPFQIDLISMRAFGSTLGSPNLEPSTATAPAAHLGGGFAVYPVLTGERPPIVRLRTRQGDILSMFHRKQRVAMAHKSGPKGAGMNISVGSSERAPIIYFDGIATYGFQAGVLQLELGASTV